MLVWKFEAVKHVNRGGKMWSVEDHGYVDDVLRYVLRTSKTYKGRHNSTLYRPDDSVVAMGSVNMLRKRAEKEANDVK